MRIREHEVKYILRREARAEKHQLVRINIQMYVSLHFTELQKAQQKLEYD